MPAGQSLYKLIFLSLAFGIPFPSEFGQLFADQKDKAGDRLTLVESFTGSTLRQNEVKLGSTLEYGLTDQIMIGSDLLATALGAPSLQLKQGVYRSSFHAFALGVRAAYLDKKTLLWGSMDRHFSRLSARVVSPGLAWTNILSERLNVHTYWSFAFGEAEARLSEKGRQRLWEAKHPNGNYETREEEPEEENAEKKSNSGSTHAYRTAQVSSLMGLLSQIFQITGEFTRESGNKILITSRIDRSRIEKLKANTFRLTAAQQWIWENFQFRLGLGMQYLVLSGRDLDSETVDSAELLPASDIDFYWRF